MYPVILLHPVKFPLKLTNLWAWLCLIDIKIRYFKVSVDGFLKLAELVLEQLIAATYYYLIYSPGHQGIELLS